jgi:hypothetical protein
MPFPSAAFVVTAVDKPADIRTLFALNPIVRSAVIIFRLLISQISQKYLLPTSDVFDGQNRVGKVLLFAIFTGECDTEIPDTTTIKVLSTAVAAYVPTSLTGVVSLVT